MVVLKDLTVTRKAKFDLEVIMVIGPGHKENMTMHYNLYNKWYFHMANAKAFQKQNIYAENISVKKQNKSLPN